MAEQSAMPTRPPWKPRPSQIPPDGDWSVWLILAGRGWGKTRTGAEWFRSQLMRYPHTRIIAATYADARDICVEGESGLRGICAPGELVKWNRSIGEGEFKTGARFKIFSGEEPDRLRGPQSYADWYDELAAWRYAQATWDMAMMGLRLGINPQACVTTTSKPIKLLRELQGRPDVRVTRGSTYENRDNLAPGFFQNVVARYEGTRLGRQELYSEILEDTPGALWTNAMLDASRVAQAPPLERIVVAIDPAVTSGEGSDETGIVVAGVGSDGHGYVLADYSLKASPMAWAREAVAAYRRHEADRVVAEVNNGGDLVETTLRMVDEALPFTAVRAARGKVARAEPVAALYEQGRVHHVGVMASLESQMTTWVQGENSPDRIDALVWALTELMVTGNSWLLL